MNKIVLKRPSLYVKANLFLSWVERFSGWILQRRQRLLPPYMPAGRASSRRSVAPWILYSPGGRHIQGSRYHGCQYSTSAMEDNNKLESRKSFQLCKGLYLPYIWNYRDANICTVKSGRFCTTIRQIFKIT